MHVVVVDPSSIVHRVITSVLAPRGYQLTAFSDSEEALRFVEDDQSVDVVLTSLEMTPMPGLELCWHIRNLGRSIYSIAMSSQASSKSLAEALDSGADDFVEKPPKPEALLARLRAAGRLLDAHRKLTVLAERDPLTGLYNRRAFFARGTEYLKRAGCKTPGSVVMFDIDHFKNVNDTFGHSVGDKVIKSVSAAAAEAFELAGRLGGEEFAALMPVTSDKMVAAAERLRERIDDTVFQWDGGHFSITCSFGVTQQFPGESLEDVLKRADKALYTAKDSGRNRVELAKLKDDSVAVRRDRQRARMVTLA